MSLPTPSKDLTLIPPHPITETESTPLLAHPPLTKPQNTYYNPKHKPLIVVSICVLCVLVLEIGVYLQLTPITRILESIICRNYYLAHPETGLVSPIPEAECKIAAVQSELTMLRGWAMLFDCLPSRWFVKSGGLADEGIGVCLTVPYGFVADKYGRKPVLMLSLLGLFASMVWIFVVCSFPDVFPIKCTWFSSLFLIIGGGGGVAQSSIFTFIADVVDETHRTPIFFGAYALILITQMVSIPLGSVLMEKDLWLPMYLSLGLLGLSVLVIIPMPETLNRDVESTESSSLTNHDEEESSKPGNVFTQILETSRDTLYGFKSLFTSTMITVLVFTFLVNGLTTSSANLYLQYASRRYHWTIAEAGFLLPLRSGVQLAMLLLILPYISHLLVKYGHFSINKKDLYIARVSVVSLMLGCIGIGLSPTPVVMAFFLVIYSLGFGFPVAVRSLATSLVEPHHIARLYAAIATLDNIGGMISGPMLSMLYSRGLSLDGAWVGLPFLASGVAYALVGVPLWVTRLRSHRCP
ncbi:MFS general substrate transporter [Glarea lozoyensis ATCC 20868]|uniref:MFS general substrate transporter n=1 Tax=Glarea lozoyensis (strain ATCC 20868 / MF5171) TaxID=1116229 RepID=S3DW22_GLAL2|nr:MFS general substrate transporter [Glarea lozoyensis ATCC 20868]EPE30593.1 MFS general substrate transporter [Glarea lozoyensis ATCC 20868]